MNRISWRSVTIVSRMLESDERDAVLGDLAESDQTGGQALRDVVGLVVRRQAAVWMDWRPWLTLLCVIVPLGMLLSFASRRTSSVTAVYIWMYANNWNRDLLGNAGFWYELAHVAAFLFWEYLALVCLSWTGGFVLGSLSRRIVRVNGVLFSFMLVFGVIVGAPLYIEYYSHYLQHAFALRRAANAYDPVSALMFYRVLFPLIIQLALVVTPSLWGLRRGTGVASLRPSLRFILWAAAIATVAAMVTQVPGVGLFFWRIYRQPMTGQNWLIHFLQLVVYWPLAYMVASAIARRWHGRTAST